MKEIDPNNKRWSKVSVVQQLCEIGYNFGRWSFNEYMSLVDSRTWLTEINPHEQLHIGDDNDHQRS